MSTATSKLKRASSNGTPIANATTTLIADPGDGVTLRIRKIVVSNGSATGTWAQFLEAGGTKYYNVWLTIGVPVIIEFERPWELAASTAFQMVTSAAGAVEYTVEYEIVTL